jgi:hypothetical protein
MGAAFLAVPRPSGVEFSVDSCVEIRKPLLSISYYFLVLHACYLYSVWYGSLIRYARHPTATPFPYPSLSLDPRKAAARRSKPAARRTKPPARRRDSGRGAERRRSDRRRDCGRDAGGVHEQKVPLEL